MPETGPRLRRPLHALRASAARWRSIGRRFRVATLVLAGWLLAGESLAQMREPGTADQRLQQEAIAAIPFDRLNQEAHNKLKGIVSRPSIYRRLPVTVVPADPDLYLFLVRYPEVIVNIWQLMGITNVRVQRTGEFTFAATDGAGTVCDVELIYGDRNVHVFHAEGVYEGPLLRRLIRGRCVLVLRSTYARTESQEVFVTNTLDVFAQLDNVGAEIIARTLHPLVESTLDHNFAESTRFLGQVSEAAEKRGPSLQQLTTRLTSIDPDVRDAFAVLTASVNHRAALRDARREPWNSEASSTPVSVAPVVNAPMVIDGTRSSQSSSPADKPLRLRR